MTVAEVDSQTPAAAFADRSAHVTVITPARGWPSLRLGELWRGRELLYFLSLRDIKVRYAQAVLGIAWAVLQPLLMAGIFTIFLGRLANLASDGIPYSLFALAGLIPWTFFANAVGSATNSLVGSSALISRVYFARLLVPLASLLSWLPDFAIGCALLVVFMLPYGFVPQWEILLLPLVTAFAVLAAASVAVWLSALNVAYRDVRYAVPFLLQLWLFATPVVFPASVVPDRFRLLFGLNPMTGVVEGFRWALLGRGDPPWGLMGISAVMASLVLVAGVYYFRRVEQRFADII